MGLLEILMLGVALATDAFSVTISNTFAFDDHRFSRLMRMPLFFGLFQFGMPLAGYFVGGIAAELIEKYAGMVSLVILGFIGSNMLYSGYKALKEDASEEDEEDLDHVLKNMAYFMFSRRELGLPTRTLPKDFTV